MSIKKGDWVDTPRFCKVKLEKVFKTKQTAYAAGFTEPTHYHDADGYTILGKSTSLNHMIFAGAKEI